MGLKVPEIVTSSVIIWLLSGNLMEGGEGVTIRHLQIPSSVQNGTESSVILDCDYSLEPDEDGLVIKWYINDLATPVYQWIPTQRPQVLGILKGRLNLEYRASSNEQERHRALQIINPTVELAGVYKCVVSTFQGEASKSEKMIIYVPEKSLQLTQERVTEDSVTVRCTAEGVFPKPNITLSSRDDRLFGEVVSTEVNGLYNIETFITLTSEQLETETEFTCVLSIPDTDYTSKKTYSYRPASSSAHWISTHSLLSTFAISLLAVLKGLGSSASSYLWWL